MNGKLNPPVPPSELINQIRQKLLKLENMADLKTHRLHEMLTLANLAAKEM